MVGPVAETDITSKALDRAIILLILILLGFYGLN
jgi:hypothetical protein